MTTGRVRDTAQPARKHGPGRRAVGYGLALALGIAGAIALTSTSSAAQPTAARSAQTTAKATFAGGCFWCVEADFDKVPGVLTTTSGYTGGTVANPSYRQVAGKTTGHAEAVEIVFDPARVSYAQLLERFWRSIDPTTVDRQFCDIGSPYRTAIFVHDAAQRAQAQASLEALQRSKPFPQPIVTPIVDAGPFYAAEAEHQDYHQRNPLRYKYYRNGCGRDARLEQLWSGRPG